MKKIYPLLEKSLNTYLKLDPQSFIGLKELSGYCVKVQLSDIPFSFFLFFEPHGVKVLPVTDAQPCAIINAKSFHLISSTVFQNNHQDIYIDGNVEIGYQVYGLFKNIEIDWEEHLSQYVGDVVAHEMGNFARSFKNKINLFRTSLFENITEYVHEEIQWFPPRQELEDFFEDVESLRKRIERLDAYVNASLKSVA